MIAIYPGITVKKASTGATVLSLLYSADPLKASGESVWCDELKMEMSPWLYGEYLKMTDKARFKQEYLIDGSATQGSLVFQLNEEATLEKSFPIPEHWTRYFSLDPHPAVPHAALWGACDPYGDLWIYREFWPSNVSYRYESGILLGKPGPCPDDERCRIRDFVAALRFFEGSDNPENKNKLGERFDETIQEREIDYAARAFGQGTQDDDPTDNYQLRFEQHMGGRCKCDPKCKRISRPEFKDAKKNRGVGEELVNDWLKPRSVSTFDGGQETVKLKSRLHIFPDRCPELIYQLKHNRRQQLSADQAEKMDPTGKPVNVRKHMTDNLLYMIAANPKFVEAPKPVVSRQRYIEPGIAY